MKYAFEDLNPFPSKAYLRQRQSLYLQVIQERLQKRLQLRQFLSSSDSHAQSDQLCDLPIEVIEYALFGIYLIYYRSSCSVHLCRVEPMFVRAIKNGAKLRWSNCTRRLSIWI